MKKEVKAYLKASNSSDQEELDLLFLQEDFVIDLLLSLNNKVGFAILLKLADRYNSTYSLVRNEVIKQLKERAPKLLALI